MSKVYHLAYHRRQKSWSPFWLRHQPQATALCRLLNWSSFKTWNCVGHLKFDSYQKCFHQEQIYNLISLSLFDAQMIRAFFASMPPQAPDDPFNLAFTKFAIQVLK